MSSLLRIVLISLCVLFCVVAQAIPEHEQAATEQIERAREIPTERAERLRERDIRDTRPIRERSFERDPREALRDLRHTLLDPTVPPSISLRERERVREEMRDYLMNQYIRASLINMRYAQDLAALEPYLYPRSTVPTSTAAAEEEDLNAMYAMAEEEDDNTDLIEQDFEISAPYGGYGGFGGFGGGYGGYGGGYGGKKGKKVPYKKSPIQESPVQKGSIQERRIWWIWWIWRNLETRKQQNGHFSYKLRICVMIVCFGDYDVLRLLLLELPFNFKTVPDLHPYPIFILECNFISFLFIFRFCTKQYLCDSAFSLYTIGSFPFVQLTTRIVSQPSNH